MIDKKGIYKNIDVSLKEGKVFKRQDWIITYSLFVSCLMLPICGVVCFLLSIYGIENFANEDLFVLTCSSIIMLFLVVGIVFVLVQKGRLRKKIYLCFDDAVELYAKTVAIDRIYYPIRPATKLMVTFYYNKRRHTLYSGDPNKNYYIIKNNGYYKILERYADKKVKILYSPKYDEVFFLKK
ncbi:MAG: hypothetical protein IJD07_03775 [Clostridia bacterium]|nr:hypothetical protein [Clostridia bacterium]